MPGILPTVESFPQNQGQLDETQTQVRSLLDELKQHRQTLKLQQTQVRDHVKVLANNQQPAQPFSERSQSIEVRNEEVNQQIIASENELANNRIQQSQRIKEYFAR